MVSSCNPNPDEQRREARNHKAPKPNPNENTKRKKQASIANIDRRLFQTRSVRLNFWACLIKEPSPELLISMQVHHQVRSNNIAARKREVRKAVDIVASCLPRRSRVLFLPGSSHSHHVSGLLKCLFCKELYALFLGMFSGEGTHPWRWSTRSTHH
jgi:hypothetical protein